MYIYINVYIPTCNNRLRNHKNKLVFEKSIPKLTEKAIIAILAMPRCSCKGRATWWWTTLLGCTLYACVPTGRQDCDSPKAQFGEFQIATALVCQGIGLNDGQMIMQKRETEATKEKSGTISTPSEKII